MLTVFIIAIVVLLAACLVPLIVYGDPAAFFKRDAVLWAAGGVALLVAILVNLMADKFPRRFDLTAEKKYSVSQELKNVLTKLDDEAKITYYVYSTMPLFVPYRRNMLDKLNEIRNASAGKINLEVVNVDPNNADDKDLVKDLDQKGFLIQATNQGENEISVNKIYSGIKMTYKDKETEYIPQIYDANLLELELATRLIPWTLTTKPIVAIDAPPAPQQQQMPGRPPRPGPFDWLAREAFDPKRFDVKSIDLTENNSIPKGTRLLMLMRPKELPDRQRYEVVKYLAEGGSVLYVAAPFKLSFEFGSFHAEKAPTGLESYFKEFGVSFGEDFIADKSHLFHSWQNPFTGEEMGRIENPLFLKIKPEFIDQESVLTRLMPGLTMPHAAEIKLDEKLLGDSKLTFARLARTTRQNWTVPYSDAPKPDLEIDKEDAPPRKEIEPKTLFAMVKGQFPFPYEGKPVPAWSASPDDKDKEKDKDKDKEKDKDKDKDKEKKPGEIASASKAPGTLVICTSPDAFNFAYLMSRDVGQFMRSNAQLLRNVAENLSLGDDLIKLRAKNYETRTLAGIGGTSNEQKRQVWKVVLVSLAPVIILLVAVYYFVFRRVNQLRYERTYAGTTGPSSFSK